MIYRFLLRSVWLLTCLGIAGCSHMGLEAQHRFDITVAEPKRMRFHGKGAGAGIMLSGAMGPMGVAIGVAIDEGIGKEIDKTARHAGFDIVTLMSTALDAHLQTSARVEIERYGFILLSGENDPVSPQLHLTWSDGLRTIQVKYPEDFPDDTPLTASLDKVKADGAIIVDLHEKSAMFVTRKLAASIH